jgi:hypothetical protein
MQADSAEHQPLNPGVTSDSMDNHSPAEDNSVNSLHEPTHFHGQFTSCMEMYAAAPIVIQYLNAHQDWFRRCAHPMKADPLGVNGYALTIGRFGSFGYEIEPRIGLDLLPPDQQGIYRIQTIPIPDYDPVGYDVDFQASMYLNEVDNSLIQPSSLDKSQLPLKVTRVEWELDLKVTVHFPRFIHALPKSLIQTTGDRLLNQIVRQVSRRLTSKVQDDFHSTQEIALPKKRKKYPWNWGQESAQGEQE